MRCMPTILYIKANVVSVCLCVRHRHSWIAARAAAAGGRTKCHGLLYIQCGCVTWVSVLGRGKQCMCARTSCHSIFTYVCTIIEWHAYA